MRSRSSILGATLTSSLVAAVAFSVTLFGQTSQPSPEPLLLDRISPKSPVPTGQPGKEHAPDRAGPRIGDAPPGHPLPEMFRQDDDVRTPETRHVAGKILVKLVEQSSPEAFHAKYADHVFEQVYKNMASSDPAPRDDGRKRTARGGTGPDAIDRSDLARWYRVELPAGIVVAQAVDAFLSDADVEAAEPIYEWGLSNPLPPDGSADPIYALQWHLPAIRAPEAW